MKIIYFVVQGILLFIVRQAALPILGGLSDIILIALPGFIWLWQGKPEAWWSLMVASVLTDLVVIRVLPFYTLASIVSLAICYLLILPYLSQGTNLIRLVTLVVWLVIWRLCYFAWLALGWFVGGQPLDFQQLLLPAVGWLPLGLTLAGLILVISRLIRQFSSRESH